MSTLRPKPRRERLRLELIVPEPRFQLRAYPDGATFDEDYVKHLLDLLAGGAEFDPLELVEEDRGKGREPLRHLIDGMNRHEAYRRAGAGTVEVLVFPGTARDAEFWALASNAKHGRARTPEDCRKAFDRLLSSAAMLERVINDRGKFQGTERALAAACGLSHGAVGKYLRERNLRVDRLTGKLIPADGPASPEREARKALVAECAANGLNVTQTAEALGISAHTVKDYRTANAANETSAPKPASRTASMKAVLARAGERSEPARNLARAGEAEQPAPALAPTATPEPAPVPTVETSATPAPVDSSKARAVAEMLANPTAAAELTVEQIVKDLAKLAEKVDAVSKSGLRDRLERIARGAGVPFELAEVDAKPIIPRPGDSLKKVVRSWPALATIQGVFSALVTEIAMGEFGPERD